MSTEILVNRMGKQTTVFYYNFLQAAYQSEAFLEIQTFFQNILRCTNKTSHTSPVPFVSTRRQGAPPCGRKRTSNHFKESCVSHKSFKLYLYII